MRPSSKCILVTGASGFVGSRLVSRLKHHGHTIVATCTGEAPAHSEGIHWLKWNALTHQLPEIEERVDTVIHLAGHRDYHQWPDKAAEIFDVAVGSTVAWLEFARIRGVKSFILASTGDALGNMDRTQREDDGDYRPAKQRKGNHETHAGFAFSAFSGNPLIRTMFFSDGFNRGEE